MKQLSQQSPSTINRKARSQRSRVNRPSFIRVSSDSTEWPTVTDWTRRQQEWAARKARRLGIGTERIAGPGVGSSQVINVLGWDSFSEFKAVRTQGQVIWCNFELARDLGFDVPKSNALTPEFHEQLLEALAFRAVTQGQDVSGRKIVTLYADKYGGDGLGPALGAGRAGFLTYGNLYIKGLGFTPLFKHDDADDFAHSHGAVHLDDCLSEAVFGEVNGNLFSLGSTRILAVIDEGCSVVPPSGRPIPVALVVRAGAQLRPAHLLTRLRSKRALLDKFVSITSASGQLVTRHDSSSGETLPDISATMLRIVDDHARTAAESFRWRIIHGALSASNMEISGAMLDLPTQSSQPRTAPVWCLDYTGSIYGAEHNERAALLTPFHRKLMRNIPLSEWPRFNLRPLNLKSEMARAYSKHLEVKLMSAAGLKTRVAMRIQSETSSLATSFAEVIVRMARLRNRGPLCLSKEAAEYVCVLDVFNLLRSFPSNYFAAPHADHRPAILRHLKPIFRGNRFHVAKQKVMVNEFVGEFARLYQDLMTVCRSLSDIYYDDLSSMQASIVARAAFENEPLELLFTRRLYVELRQVIADYRATGDTELIRDAIDRRVNASLRSVDGLLAQGNSRRLHGGGIELEMRTIDGINYSVRAWNDALQTRILRVSVPVERRAEEFVTGISNLPQLTTKQVASLRYRFTTDGWKNSAELEASRMADDKGEAIVFEAPTASPLVGRLNGFFYLSGNGRRVLRKSRRYGGYTFAIPDRQELIEMVGFA